MGERKRAFSFVVVVAAVGALAALRCGGGGTKVVQKCTGSGLANDPSGRNCMIPISPTQNCSNGFAPKIDAFATLPSPTFDAETKVAFDPHSGSKTVFAATIQSDTIPDSEGEATTCLVNKHVALYRSTDGGTKFDKMGGLPTGLPGEWATDPTIAVGPDGTLYLVFLRWMAPCAASSDTTCNRCSPSGKAVTDVEIWFAPPGATAVQPGLPDSQEIKDALAPMQQNGMRQTAFPTAPGQLPAIAGTNGGADHPEIAVDPSTPGHIAVYVRAPSGNDFIATFRQPTSTAQFAPSEGSPISLPQASVFANPAFDGAGNLYVPMGIFVPGNLAQPTILKFSVVNGAWAPVGSLGTPPVLGTYAFEQVFNSDVNPRIPSTPQVNFLPDTTPAVAVGTVGNSTDAVIYLGFEVIDSNNLRQVELIAANASAVTTQAPNWQWTTPKLVPVPTGALMSFHPALSLNGGSDALDVVTNSVLGTAGAVPSALSVSQFFHRYDASSLALLTGPFALNKASPSVADLPRRPSTSSFVTVNTIYTGDYNGVAVNGLNASVSFSDLKASGAADVELAVAQVSTKCGSALTLVDPDSLWECNCQCGGSESFFEVVGCAAGTATTAAAACPQVCAGQNLCGASLTCTVPVCNGSFNDGRRLSTQSCALSDGPPARSAPAPLADYVGDATPASNAVFHVGGQATTTALGGHIYMNASTSPPTAGATAEIARLDMRPADVFIGGSVNATIRNILVLHPGRIAGTFTDATHFTVAPGGATFVTTLQTGSGVPDPDNPDATGLSAPTNIALSNPTPISGTLDLANGTIALDGTASDSAGNSLDLHFRTTISGRPTDSDHDGIIDAVDRCPGTTPGPDRTAPAFTFVPPSKIITSCSGAGASIGTAVATDPCGVTITSNAPAKFPLGTTVVTWTARDGAGNVATATQVITAVLGNDTTCCPTGSHVIVGTSNNDVLVGTSGVDCILGLGGQDRISGGGGDDVISGGDGNDIIFGEAGNDRLFGGSGQDTISGGPGNDLLDGGDGVDTLNGDDGNDLLRGGQGGDIIHGGPGADFIDGGLDDDQLHGDDDNDIIFGGANNDRLFGENGNDILDGEDGDDTLDGGSGVNRLNGGAGHNVCIDNGATIECKAEDD